jgi:uncharacterized protein YjbI with pentapeptide repeats
LGVNHQHLVATLRAAAHRNGNIRELVMENPMNRTEALAEIKAAMVAGRLAHLHDAVLTGAILSHAILSHADLSHADLSHAILSHAILSHADLSHADLSHAILSHANLSHAILSHANLSHAILHDAVLTGALLIGANLTGALLTNANLTGAILHDANLTSAILRDANLTGALLTDANLTGALLTDANLRNANLHGAIIVDDIRLLAGSAVTVIAFDHHWPLELYHTDRGTRIMAGCHRDGWTPTEARTHWQAHPDEQRRRIVLPALEAGLAIARAQGWRGAE